MIVKVCGMRDAENIREVEALRPDWMGFIFWPKSSRYVSEFPEYMPIYAKRVGVFVDQPLEEVTRTAWDYALDIIQLHGAETPEYVRELHKWETVKAFNIATAADFARTEAYEGIADYFLFDTKGPAVGGNGEKFDWGVLSAYRGDTPFLLSGGIGPDDAPAIRQVFAPDSSPAGKCIGIDLNSRFETAPGMKDAAALRRFLSQLSH